jgi:hypothetical protein
MQPLSTGRLLRAWELGGDEPQKVDRAIALLEAGYPDVPRAALVRLSIGERDSLLLALRDQVFGPRLTALAVCPGCGERLELGFETADVRADRKQDADELLNLRLEDYEITFRFPNSLDLAALPEEGDVQNKRQALLHRVISRAHYRGAETAPTQLPETVIAAIEERMAQADPQAEIQLNLSCAACGHGWQALFDIVSFFWGEVDAWAVRLLREVHSLARAYGWREADILAMSPGRRLRYLEMLSG